MTTFEQLNLRLTREPLIGIIGLGYVGLPLADAFHTGGCRVLGFDIDQAKIDALATGTNYLKHLGAEMTTRLASSDRFSATTDFSRLAEPDAIIICVPTPLGRHNEPDMSYVINSARDVGRAVRPGQLVVLESTTYPGTTRQDMLPVILREAAARDVNLTPGTDLFVAFSPEREDPGRTSHTTRTTPKLVGGLDDASTDLAVALYKRAVQAPVRVSAAEVAEAAKVLENIFRAVNIAMVNELKVIFDHMGIDVWEVIDAAATKPFGFMPFYPGPGLGGHCIPIDPFYLTWKAREYGQNTRFIELAGEINTRMPRYVVERTVAALNDDRKPAAGSRILVSGLAYKKNIDDVRETPAAEIIEEFFALGCHVDYHDPHVPVFPRMRKHKLELTSVPLSPQAIASYDAVVIVTDHTAVDYRLYADHARLIVDTRNATKGLRPCKARVVKA